MTNNSNMEESKVGGDKQATAKVDKNKKEEEISEEDQKLIEEIELIVERLKETGGDEGVAKLAQNQLRGMLKTSTGSLTSVPKPLKYLRGHYETLKKIYEGREAGELKKQMADILSLLGMTYAREGERECLKYRVEAGSGEEEFDWGHEYVRHLALELGDGYRESGGEEKHEGLVRRVVQYLFAHNAEAEGVDLLAELEEIEAVEEVADSDNYERTSKYLVGCSPLMPSPMDRRFLEMARQLYNKYGRAAQSLEVSMRLGDEEKMVEDFKRAESKGEQIQLSFMLAQYQKYIEEIGQSDELVSECMSNSKLSSRFLEMAKELNLEEPKVPEDIYKSNMDNNSSRAGPTLDSARHNLASTFVNGFVNAGFCNDKLVTSGVEWIYKNRDSGMMSAVASLGLVMMWDVEKGLGMIDKYLYTSEPYIKAGAVLGIGLFTAGIRDETDTAKAVLSEYLADSGAASELKAAAIMGLGISYAGSNREDVAEMLVQYIGDMGVSMELASLAGLSAGMVCLGSSNGDVASTILQAIMERSDSDLGKPYARFLGLGLGLLYYGRQEESEMTLETLQALDNQIIGAQASVMVQMCAHAGSGNVLQIQQLLKIVGEHPSEGEDHMHLSFAVLGIALVSMAEPIGTAMALRGFEHIMHYGEAVVKRAVPLAIGLLYVSDPQVHILETLSKYSHDSDSEIAMNAILAMGYVGAGTNNARLAQMLRQLVGYYYKQPDCLFMVRIAQGLLHMAKGTMTLSPHLLDRSLVSPVAVAALLVPLVASTVPGQALLLKSHHYLLFYLARAMAPRFLITCVYDEENDQVEVVNGVNVRVGQSVDAVGQAGKPKTLAGFQTHKTPVLLANGERAELATSDEYTTYGGSCLERFIMLTRNSS